MHTAFTEDLDINNLQSNLPKNITIFILSAPFLSYRAPFYSTLGTISQQKKT